MSLGIIEFRELTFFLFLLYFYLETKIYITLWAALYYAIKAITHLFHINMSIYKAIVACYVLVLLVVYLYKLRNNLRGNQVLGNVKLKNISSDKKKKNRIGIAAFLLLVVNIIAIIAVD